MRKMLRYGARRVGCLALFLGGCEASLVGLPPREDAPVPNSGGTSFSALGGGGAGAQPTGGGGAGAQPTGGNGAIDPGAPVDFARSIRPILVEHCLSCHGADPNTRYGKLRLDDGVDMFAERPDGRPPVVIPGDPANSALFQRVTSADDETRMPPPESEALAPEDVRLIERWILQGAPFAAHWSFAAPVRPTPPTVGDSRWIVNPVDAFVLSALEANGLAPNPPASAHALLRRVTFDLTGLPPTPGEIAAFVADTEPGAYERVVDRLLANPAYGEHRARYWLDNVRYADTTGYHTDGSRSIWPYRDYVIRAFNDDVPFDRFTIEQIAGDLLPEATLDQRVATGFVRSSMSTSEGGLVEAEFAATYAKDRTEALSLVWLGLTTGCAACHDHKFDPVTQRDFYALTAFFRNLDEPINDFGIPDTPPVVLVPPDMTPSLVAEEKADEPFAHVLERGQYDRPGERVTARVPGFLPSLPDSAPANRLGLARWLVSAEQPLTSRVVVNRFWAQLFGLGLVRTAHDFGTTGEAPTHPELLDWLAVEFRESGWDVKALFRLLVTSAAYRQASAPTPAALERDPENRWLSRGPRFRLDGEMIRDQALLASGLLVTRVGGASVKPYQPAGIWEEVSVDWSDTRTYVQDSGEDLYRRSVYTFWKRQAPPPSLQLFDAPAREEAVAQRERTNTPLQALVVMNDPQFVEAARRLAEGAMSSTKDPNTRLQHIAERVLSRPFTPEELAVLSSALTDVVAKYAAEPALANELVHVGESLPDVTLSEPELAAWTVIASTVLNLDEALSK
ncbi:MAG TPA: PSD1 and planctomycete cytochrome C domain-containing protein [Polyangiaceae bacterium]